MRAGFNPYARGFQVEDYVDRGLAKLARRARDVEIEARARGAVQNILADCEDELRADLALALIQAATEAAVLSHDPERIQAHLGKLAHQRGVDIASASQNRRFRAEAMFKGERHDP